MAHPSIGRATRALLLGASVALVASMVLVASIALAAPLGADRNTVRVAGPYPITARARALLARAPAADLHADSLLWMRDLTQRAGHGHADVPRLIEGGAGLQVFAVVTRVPAPMRMTGNSGRRDGLKRLYHAAKRPDLATADGLTRALDRAAALQRAAEDPRVHLVRSKADLARAAPGELLALLALEGLHGPATPETIDRLFAAGYRMIGPVHFTDTSMGGSAHGLAVRKGGGGLTADGAAALDRMRALGMLVDLAHASPALFDDVLARGDAPVVVSHTGVAGTCPGPRNLTDDQLRRVAASGGVVGIGYWKAAVCGRGVEAIVAAIRHAVDVAGPAHVALGSDFDGAITAPFDARGVGLIVEGLLASGLPVEHVEAIVRGNVLRVLGATLPDG